MGRKKKEIITELTPAFENPQVNTDFTPYAYTSINDTDTMTSVVTNINANLSAFNPVLENIQVRKGELQTDVKTVGYTGNAWDLTQDSTAKFVTDTEISGWDEIASTGITLNNVPETTEDKATVTRRVPGSTPEDITLDFRYAAGTPYMSDLTNDGDPAHPTEGPYLTTRDIFVLYNITATRFEDNADGDDYEYFGYTALVDLNNYLYNGTNLNNCIYPQECRDIEDYTALVCFKQSSANLLSIDKLSRTSYLDGLATVQFDTTFSAGTIEINSILFVRKDRNHLPSTYISADYLESANSAYMNTGFNKDYTGQFGVIFTAFNGTTSGDINSIAGNADYIGIQYNGTEWHWIYHYNGADNVDSSGAAVALSSYYHIEIIDELTEGVNKRKVFVNGQKIFDLTKVTGDSSSIYLFANNNSGTAEHFTSMKLYPTKIFNSDTQLLLGDYVPCTNGSNEAQLFNLVDPEHPLSALGSGTIVAGFDPKISDYILIGNNAPTYLTRGHENQFYRVKGTNDYYICLGYTPETGYIWQYSLLNFTYN